MRAPLTLALCTLVTAQPPPRLGPTDLERNGPSENRVDVIVMGDGYRADQQNQFNDIAKHVPKLFEHDPALGEYQRYFNFARVNLVSKDDGISGYGRTYDTALGGYMTGDVKGHGQAGVDHSKVDAVLAGIPQQDGLAIVFVNKGSLGTGGGGVAVIGGREDDTVIHEWGHAFAGLGDEYIDMVHRGAAGQSANVSNSSDPKKVPWCHCRAPSGRLEVVIASGGTDSSGFGRGCGSDGRAWPTCRWTCGGSLCARSELTSGRRSIVC